MPGAAPAIADLESHFSALGVSAGISVVIVSAGANSTECGSAARVCWRFNPHSRRG
jgi:hypothetical protein